MDKIEFGVIGTGNIVHWMLSAVAKTEGIACNAVYSRTAENGNALAEKYHIPKVYTQLEDMLQDPDIPFIYVASPNLLHYEHVKQALEHGKHVICEKPFCPVADQVAELVALAREKGLYLIDAVPPIYLPNFALVKQNLHKIGQVRLVLCNYTQYSSRYDQFLEGRVSNVFDPKLAGGTMQDINFYNIFFLYSLFGAPSDFKYYPNLLSTGADGSGILIMQYPGFLCEATAAKDCKGYGLALIEGEKGYIEIKDGTNLINQVRVVSPEGEEVLNAQTHEDRWLYEIQGMVPHLLAEDRPFFDRQLDTTIEVIRIMEKARVDAGIRFPCDK